jgi:3-hydroxybutyryl-CoA dehydratase
MSIGTAHDWALVPRGFAVSSVDGRSLPPSIGGFSVGQEHRITATVTAEDVVRFAELSGDHAPLHTDAAFARRHGFAGILVHGAFLTALVSRLVGMHFPGRDALLERCDLAFRAPCYAPCDLQLTARVRQTSESVASIVLDVTIADSNGTMIVTGKTWHRVLSAP